jgi:hypothetical protein
MIELYNSCKYNNIVLYILYCMYIYIQLHVIKECSEKPMFIVTEG